VRASTRETDELGNAKSQGPMRTIILVSSILLQATVAAAPAFAQGTCPNTCPEGEVRSNETGKCEPYKPLMV